MQDPFHKHIVVLARLVVVLIQNHGCFRQGVVEETSWIAKSVPSVVGFFPGVPETITVNSTSIMKCTGLLSVFRKVADSVRKRLKSGIPAVSFSGRLINKAL